MDIQHNLLRLPPFLATDARSLLRDRANHLREQYNSQQTIAN